VTYAPDLVDVARVAFGHGTLIAPDRTAHAENPLCGDEIDLDVELADGGARISSVVHRTRGCTFTLASASLLAQATRGRTIDEARALAYSLQRDLRTSAALPSGLELLAGVRIYPARLRCALLPWDALLAALRDM